MHKISKVEKRNGILKTISNDFYGAYWYNYQEVEAVSRIINNKSPFRYYGSNMLNETEKFEENCRQYFGVKYAHALNSGTGALMCALHALGVGPGDEVIIPGYFFSAVYSSILLRGAIPVLGEIDETLNLDPDDFEKKITHKTKCVIVIHMDGVPARVEQIMNISHRKGICVIEDFSQCIGGIVNGNKLGSFGDVAITSLQLNKMITSGEGGLLLTNNEHYYHKAVARSDIGFQRIDRELNSLNTNPFLTYGEGRRFSEIGSAIMNVQLIKLDAILEKMKKTKQLIKQRLGDITPIKFKTIIDENGDIGSTLTLIFESEKQSDIFLDVYSNLCPNGEMKLFRHSEWAIMYIIIVQI